MSLVAKGDIRVFTLDFYKKKISNQHGHCLKFKEDTSEMHSKVKIY